jgi:hypothetical protein
MADSVGSTDSWMNFGQDYAKGLAASVDPRLQALAKRLAGLKTGDQVSSETSALYQPAIEQAGRIGQDVTQVGMGGMAALTGLGSSLPGGMDTGFLADAARQTSRAGGSAALLGGVLGSSARAQLAESILGQQQNLQQERFGLEDQTAAAESEKAKLASDWLGYSTQGQGLETARLTNLGTEADTEATKVQTERNRWQMENFDPAQLAQMQVDTGLSRFDLEQMKPAELESTIAGTKGTRASTANTKAQTDLVRGQIKGLKGERAATALANALSRGKITEQGLTNAGLLADLKKAGVSSSQIKKIIADSKKRGGTVAAV